ncbi:MAG: hypothetical protein ACOCNL_14885, partial [Acetivibrio ethanolgignens]
QNQDVWKILEVAGYLNIILHFLNFNFLNLAIIRKSYTAVNKKRCIDTEATPKQTVIIKRKGREYLNLKNVRK